MRSQGGSVRGVGGHGGRDVGREVEHGETERVQGSGFVRAVPCSGGRPEAGRAARLLQRLDHPVRVSGEHPGVLTEHDTEVGGDRSPDRKRFGLGEGREDAKAGAGLRGAVVAELGSPARPERMIVQGEQVEGSGGGHEARAQLRMLDRAPGRDDPAQGGPGEDEEIGAGDPGRDESACDVGEVGDRALLSGAAARFAPGPSALAATAETLGRFGRVVGVEREGVEREEAAATAGPLR